MSDDSIHDDLLIAMALDDLDPTLRDEVCAQLARSPAARARLEEYRDLVETAQTTDADDPPAGVLTALLSAQAGKRESWTAAAVARFRSARLVPVAVAATLILALLGSRTGTGPNVNAASVRVFAAFPADALVGRPAPDLAVSSVQVVGDFGDDVAREPVPRWQSLLGDSGSWHDSL